MCRSPIQVRNAGRFTFSRQRGYQESLVLPCGKCPPCQKKRVNQWSFRLEKELIRSNTAYFVTLTYNQEYLEENCITDNGYMTLRKKHLQNYFKRLRHGQKKDTRIDTGNKHDIVRSIRYYACGEYGSKRRRPHYHIILFNGNVQSIRDAWSINGIPIGDVHIGEVNGKTIRYTLKYINKGGNGLPYYHEKCDSEKEFAVMSRGLGDNYLTESVKKYYRDNLDKNYLSSPDGYKVTVPRYYQRKIHDLDTTYLQECLYGISEAWKGFKKSTRKKCAKILSQKISEIDLHKSDRKYILAKEAMRCKQEYDDKIYKISTTSNKSFETVEREIKETEYELHRQKSQTRQID